MKLAGIEEHLLSAEVRADWSDMRLKAIDRSIAADPSTVERDLLDPTDEQIALVDEPRLDVQVLSSTTPAHHDLGPGSVDLTRRTLA